MHNPDGDGYENRAAATVESKLRTLGSIAATKDLSEKVRLEMMPVGGVHTQKGFATHSVVAGPGSGCAAGDVGLRHHLEPAPVSAEPRAISGSGLGIGDYAARSAVAISFEVVSDAGKKHWLDYKYGLSCAARCARPHQPLLAALVLAEPRHRRRFEPDSTHGRYHSRYVGHG